MTHTFNYIILESQQRHVLNNLIWTVQNQMFEFYIRAAVNVAIIMIESRAPQELFATRSLAFSSLKRVYLMIL